MDLLPSSVFRVNNPEKSEVSCMKKSGKFALAAAAALLIAASLPAAAATARTSCWYTAARTACTVAAEGFNAEGRALAETVSLYRDYRETVAALLETDTVAGLLAEGGLLELSVIDPNPDRGAASTAALEPICAGAGGSCHQLDPDAVAEAHSCGLSYGRYQLRRPRPLDHPGRGGRQLDAGTATAACRPRRTAAGERTAERRTSRGERSPQGMGRVAPEVQIMQQDDEGGRISCRLSQSLHAPSVAAR